MNVTKTLLLRTAEVQLLRSPTVNRLRTVVSIRNRIKSCDMSKISKSMLWSMQTFYEYADEPQSAGS